MNDGQFVRKLPTGCLPWSLKTKPEKLGFLALAGCICLTHISIAASELLLAAAIIAYLWLWKRQGVPCLPGLRIMLPLLAYMVWTLVAALVSSNPMLALTVTKKFYLFTLVALVPVLARGENLLTWIYKAIFSTAVIASVWGLAQYIAEPNRDLLHRIAGFMSQWMTYSGLLMLSLVLLVAYAFYFGWSRHLWIIPAGTLIVLALILAQTRSTLIGALAGIALVVLVRRPKAITGLLVFVIAFYLLLPPGIKDRVKSGLDPADPNTRNRIELFETAARLIYHHPWFGVGPKNVKYEALRYRGSDEFPDWMYQHMHNNLLQTASETGIIGVMIWLWFMLRLAWDAACTYRRALRQAPNQPGDKLRGEALLASSAALAGWTALMAAGMFEYNFGDSEILILFLFIVSAPYTFYSQLADETPRTTLDSGCAFGKLHPQVKG